MNFPLSADQAALWFADARADEGRSHHVSHAVEVTGPLDPALFRSCWERLAERHEALRARFGEELGVPYQEIRDRPALDWGYEEAAGRSDEEVRAELLADAARPLDLGTGPALRLRVHSFGEQRHWVLLAVHPIVADARSLAVLVAEFGELYAAGQEGRQALLAPVPGGYAATVARQREWRRGPEAARLLDAFAASLSPAPEPLRISPDLPRPGCRDENGAAVTQEVPAPLVTAVEAFCADRGVTPAVFLSTAYQLLLHLRTGQDRIVVGVPASTRPAAGRLVGSFTNTAAVSLDLTGDPAFGELLTRAQAAATTAREARRVPLADVAARVGARRDGGREPLVQAAFTHVRARPQDPLAAAGRLLLAAPGTRVAIGPLTVRPLPAVRSVTPYEWELVAVEEPGRITLSLRYDDGRFAAATATALLGHLEELIGRVLAEPGLPVSALPRTSRAQERELAAWNRTGWDYDGLPWVHEAFRDRAGNTPDAVALRCAGESVTYRELDRRVNAMAWLLRDRGVGPGSVVGVALERSTELVVALLGTVAAGAAYLPLDPDYPSERVRFMVEDSGASLVLAQPHLKDRLPDLSVPVLWLDGPPEERCAPDGSARPPLDARVRPATIAYVIYTSGSTGLPKGTLITHAGLRNRIAWMQEQYGLEPDDRVLQKTPSSFDVSVWEFFWPLTRGACLVLARPGGQRDVEYLAEVIRAEGVTTLHFVPSVLRLFLAEPSIGQCVSLRRMFCSGEALPLDLVEAVLDRLPCELHNLYGPTEATVDVTWWPCQAGDDTVPIGFPVANTAIHVLDRAGRALPPGIPGEIHIGGVQLAAAYLNRPRLTAERFVPDPFSGTPGARLYRTGDLGQYRGDGAVEYLGRLDHQLKLHGNRIEIGEIEACLSAHPAVRAAVVTVARRGEAAVLEGHVVPADGIRPDLADLAAHLKGHLPSFMIPSRITLLDRLPLTPSGKADRKALQESGGAVGGPAAGVRLPARTPAERTVVRLLTEVLGVSEAGMDEDFFALGGSDPDVLRLRARLRQAGLEIAVPEILRRPTAGAIARAARPVPGEPFPVVEPFALLTDADRVLLPQGLEDAYPLTGQQRKLVEAGRPGPDAGRQVLTLSFDGEFGEPAMRAALDALAARHESARSSLDTTGFGEPLLLVSAQARGAVPLRVHGAAVRPEQVVEALRSEPAGESRTPLLRAEVVPRPGAFTVVLGHTVFDRWSMGLLAGELMEFYAASARGRDPLPSARPLLRGAALVALERGTAPARERAGEAAGELERQPAGDEACLLPRRHHGGLRAASSAAVAVPDEILDGLLDLARATGTSLRDLFLTAHLKVVGVLAGRSLATTGVVTDCRPAHAEADRAAGAFARVLPLQADLAAGSWRELIGRVTRADRESRGGRHALRPASGTAFDTVFEHIDFEPYEALGRLPGIRLLEWQRPTDPGRFALAARFRRDPGTGAVTFVLDCGRETADERRLAQITGYYARALAAMAAAADGPHRVDLRGAEERAVSEALAGVETPWSDAGPTGAHHRVALAAARSPHAVAVQCAGERLTYAELDSGADALAARLPSDAVVAVVAEPSPGLPLALLAVLRAGSAYLMLDPGIGAQDACRILAEARVRAVVGAGADRLAAGTGLPAITEVPRPADHGAATGAEPLREGRPVDPDTTASLVYGTGARPHGVEISHRAVDDALHAVRRELNWQDRDEILLVVPSADLPPAGPELLLSLTTGARLVLATAEQARDPYALDELLFNSGATTVLAAPATWQALLDSGWPGDPGLRIVSSGPLAPAGLRASLSRSGRVTWSLYGRPETGFWSMAARIGADDQGTPLGVPLPHASCLALGPDGLPVPFGTPGVLHIGGRGPGRSHRTGELVRLRPDGVFESLSTDHTESCAT